MDTFAAMAQRISPVNDVARASDVPREWWFTFGSGHRAHSMLHGRPHEGEQGQGLRLDNRYVVIVGTFDSARARMLEIFGQVWCAQYGTRESAGVDEYNMVELPLTEQERTAI